MLLEEKFVLNNTLPGPVYAHECLGEIYSGMLDVSTRFESPVNTVLMINNIEFKYKTLDQLVEIISCSAQYLNKKGRVVVTLSLCFLIYDRLNVTADSLVDQLVDQLKSCNFECAKRYINTASTSGVGQIFLSLDYHA